MMRIKSTLSLGFGIFPSLAGGLAVVLLVGCGTSNSSSRTDATFAHQQECPDAVKRSKMRVVYGPGQAMAVWTLPKGMLATDAPVEGLGDLRSYVSRIADRMGRDASAQPGRAVRFEPQTYGAAIIVVDEDCDRLDVTRSELDRKAEMSNAGVCEDGAQPSSLAVLDPPQVD